MSIDYSMLALAVANPGLLPLAFQSDSRALPGMASSDHVKHSGKIEHEFAKGSGEELRGHKANRELIAQAYQTAIDDIEMLAIDKAELIATYDANIRADRAAETEKTKKENADSNLRRSNYETTKEAVEALQKEEKEAPKTRWGKKIFDYAKLCNAKNVHKEAADEYFNHSRSKGIDYSYIWWSYAYSASELLDKAKEEISKRKAILDLTDGELFLSRSEILDCNDMLNHKWAKIREIKNAIGSGSGD